MDEVVQPSRLDGVLQNMERCCILWRKRGKRGKHLEDEADEQEAHEAQEADDFVQLVTPRALSV